MDITEVILSDHHDQRRMFALLDDIDRSDVKTLTALWTRLSAMLEVHAQAGSCSSTPSCSPWDGD